MYYHKVCSECILNGDCLFQSNNDVESCGDFQDWENEQ